MTFEYGKLPPREIWFGAPLWPRLDLAQQAEAGAQRAVLMDPMCFIPGGLGDSETVAIHNGLYMKWLPQQAPTFVVNLNESQINVMFSIFVYSHRSFIRLFHGQKGEKPMFFVSFSCLSPRFLISSQDLKNVAKNFHFSR